jgi:hypothetical protein
MLPLRSRDLGDLGIDELAHHIQADRHRRGQQPLAHLHGERPQLVAHLPREPLGQRRISDIDQPDLRHETQAARRRARRVDAWFLIGGPPFHSVGVENPERASRHERGGGPPLNFYDAWVNFRRSLGREVPVVNR